MIDWPSVVLVAIVAVQAIFINRMKYDRSEAAGLELSKIESQQLNGYRHGMELARQDAKLQFKRDTQ